MLTVKITSLYPYLWAVSYVDETNLSFLHVVNMNFPARVTRTQFLCESKVQTMAVISHSANHPPQEVSTEHDTRNSLSFANYRAALITGNSFVDYIMITRAQLILGMKLSLLFGAIYHYHHPPNVSEADLKL